MIEQLTKIPVYCYDCKNQNTWIRIPEKDIKSNSGKIMWEAYRCKICSAKHLEPIKENI
jgi:hypothetical protein